MAVLLIIQISKRSKEIGEKRSRKRSNKMSFLRMLGELVVRHNVKMESQDDDIQVPRSLSFGHKVAEGVVTVIFLKRE